MNKENLAKKHMWENGSLMLLQILQYQHWEDIEIVAIHHLHHQQQLNKHKYPPAEIRILRIFKK